MVVRQLCHTTHSVSSADDDDDDVAWKTQVSQCPLVIAHILEIFAILMNHNSNDH